MTASLVQYAPSVREGMDLLLRQLLASQTLATVLLVDQFLLTSPRIPSKIRPLQGPPVPPAAGLF